MAKLLKEWKERQMLEALDCFDQKMAQEEQAIIHKIDQMSNRFQMTTTWDTPETYHQTGRKQAIWNEATNVRALLTEAIANEEYEIAAELQKVMDVLKRKYNNL